MSSHTTSPSLVEFVLARLAEDEAVATTVAKHPGRNVDLQRVHLDTERYSAADAEAWSREQNRTLHDVESWAVGISPARVLAEVEAKRRIVQQAEAWYGPGWWPDDILSLLALPYADHPDYDEGWRP